MSESLKTFTNTKYEGDGSAWKAAQKEYQEAAATWIDLSAKQSRGEDLSSLIADSTKSVASEASQASQAAAQAAKTAASEASQAAANAAKTAASEATAEVKAAAVEAATAAKAAAAEAAAEVKASAAEVAKEVVQETIKESVKEAITQADVDKAWNDYVGLQAQGKYLEAAQSRSIYLDKLHEKTTQDNK